MFDASSKLQSGIFNGNLMEYGSHKQCVNVYYESLYGPIRGQQCVVKITPTDNIVRKILGFRNVSTTRFRKIEKIVHGASLLWSICVPDSCTHRDVERHFNKTIQSVTQGLDLNITVSEYQCYALKDWQPLSKGEWLVILLLLLLVITVIISTVADVLTRDAASVNKTAQIFSAYANTEYILSDDSGKRNALDCLHGFRVISMFYVVCGHRFLTFLFFPTNNALEINEWLDGLTSSIITGGTVSVDTFFMLSGMLACYQTCNYLARGHKFNLAIYYLHRYVRITVSLAVVTMIYATMAHRFGSGPLWRLTAKTVQVPCQYFWWTTLLHLQNYVNPKYLCIIQTWYLTCDMQYYLYSPLLILPLYKRPALGYVVAGVAYFSSAGISFYLAWTNEYIATDLTSNSLVTEPFFTRYYIAPYTRAPTFILGVLFGYLLYRLNGTKIRMTKTMLFTGWSASTAIAVSVFAGFYAFHLENHPYNRWEQCVFLSFARSGWTMSMIWIVWVCANGHGGVLNAFLSSHFFRVLGRIAYSIFLFHLPWQFLSLGALKTPIYFSDYSGMELFFGDIVTFVLPAYLLTICVECPVVRLESMLLKRGGRNTRKIGEEKIFIVQSKK